METRTDPLGDVWESEVVPLLQADAALNAVTLLEELQRRHPADFGDGVLRTLQRRVRQWRAVYGGERKVFFAQEHPPGRQELSDFTVCNDLEVEVAGVVFAHRLYQFALAHSGWRHAVVVTTGESFMALSTGLQAALWRLGGVPEEHRTDVSGKPAASFPRARPFPRMPASTTTARRTPWKEEDGGRTWAKRPGENC